LNTSLTVNNNFGQFSGLQAVTSVDKSAAFQRRRKWWPTKQAPDSKVDDTASCIS